MFFSLGRRGVPDKAGKVFVVNETGVFISPVLSDT